MSGTLSCHVEELAELAHVMTIELLCMSAVDSPCFTCVEEYG